MPALLPPEDVEKLRVLARDTRGTVQKAVKHLRHYSRVMTPPPPPGQPLERVLYGMAQPLLGARVLLRDTDLLVESLKPALLLGAVCALIAVVDPVDGPFWLGRAKRFYLTFAILAPLPSVLFAKFYARLAALVRWRLGFGACGPREYPLGTSIRRAVEQALIVFIGVAPFILLPEVIPFVGKIIASAIIGAWGLHWVVVDAFDDARVLHPGESLRAAEAEDRNAPSPWYVRLFDLAAEKLDFLPIVPRVLHRFSRFCDKISLAWRGEIALMEGHPLVSLGFALSTAALLAIPGLNLLFRPIIIVASSHLLGHLEGEDALLLKEPAVSSPS